MEQFFKARTVKFKHLQPEIAIRKTKKDEEQNCTLEKDSVQPKATEQLLTWTRSIKVKELDQKVDRAYSKALHFLQIAMFVIAKQYDIV